VQPAFNQVRHQAGSTTRPQATGMENVRSRLVKALLLVLALAVAARVAAALLWSLRSATDACFEP
jgi:type VI protein secretion system component VasF